ncbi:hypothetical protein ACH436_00510 [Isoptericola sp. NPDC019693]|uniref:hypothetical protein n=1 Tax=Isoptericola sp. NPDC019693 TaxID=3364009 RepID=UPI0037887CA5
MSTLQEQATIITGDPNLASDQKERLVDAVLCRASQGVAEASPVVSDKIWLLLIRGLVLLAAISLGGLVYAILDGNDSTSPDLLLTAFSTALAGLLGLFVNPSK